MKDHRRSSGPRWPSHCEGEEHNAGDWVKGLQSDRLEGEAVWPPCVRNTLSVPPKLGETPPHRHIFRGSDAIFGEQFSGNGCACPGFKDEYYWQPLSCNIRPWRAVDFCDALGQRVLMLVGDSTIYQLFYRLNNALYSELSNRTCARQVLFGESGTLVGRAMGRLNYGSRWAPLVRAAQPDILLVATGGHIFGSEPFRDVIHEFLAELNRNFPHLPLIWKASAPWGCRRELLTSPPDAKFFAHHAPPLYQHTESFERDGFVRTLLGSRAHWMDFQPLWLRTDAHPGVWHSQRNWTRDQPQKVLTTPGKKHTRLYSRQQADGFAYGGPAGPGRDCYHQCFPGPIHYLLRVLLQILIVELPDPRAT